MSFTIRCDVNCEFFVDDFIMLRTFPSIPIFFLFFYERVLASVKCFLVCLLRWHNVHFFIDVIYYINWFLDVKPTLHIWVNFTWSYCMMSFMCCWILFASILLKIFIFIFIRDIDNLFSYDLFGFDITLVLNNELRHVLSASIFWGYIYAGLVLGFFFFLSFCLF